MLVKIRSQKREERKEERESRGQGIKGEESLDPGPSDRLTALSEVERLRRNDGGGIYRLLAWSIELSANNESTI